MKIHPETQILPQTRAYVRHMHYCIGEAGAALWDVQPEHGRSFQTSHQGSFDLQMYSRDSNNPQQNSGDFKPYEHGKCVIIWKFNVR